MQIMRRDLLDDARALQARDARQRVLRARDARAHRRAAVGFHGSMLMLLVVLTVLALASHHLLALR
jgi:hypothetical protein